MLSSKAFFALGTAMGGMTACAGLATLATLPACSSSSNLGASGDDASTQVPTATPLCADGGLRVAFNPMYSAYDGKHTFQVPAIVLGSAANVTWSADETMVGMQADHERPNEILITTLKAGSVAINVQSADGKCGASILTVDTATEADWEIGNARYNNGKSLHLTGGSGGGTGSPLEQGGGGPACTNCHGETATNSAYTNVSHTPEQTGGFSDAELLNIIQNGKFPAGAYFDTDIVQYPVWQNFHRWADITADQEKGIVVYLRSLTPAPQNGRVNFGAFLPDAGADDVPDAGAGPVDAGALDGATPDSGSPDAGSGVADAG